MKTLRRHWGKFLAAASATVAFGLGITMMALHTFAVAPAPILNIAPLGNNQFNIVISNAVTTTNYTIFWTDNPGDQNYPWEVLGIVDFGETNFLVDASQVSSAFFRAMLGVDSDGDGIPDWADAKPYDPSVGYLTITIDSPTNRFTF
jgi:hypothetical protein